MEKLVRANNSNKLIGEEVKINLIKECTAFVITRGKKAKIRSCHYFNSWSYKISLVLKLELFNGIFIFLMNNP